MFRLAYASYYKLVRPSKDKDPGLSHYFIREWSLFISGGGGGGELINNDRSLNEPFALSC